MDRAYCSLFCRAKRRGASVFYNYPSDLLHINKLETALPLTELPIILQFEEMPKMHYLECFRLQAQLPDLELIPPQLHLSPQEKIRKIGKPYAVLHLDYYPAPYNFRNVYGIRWEDVKKDLEQRGLQVIQISKTGKNLVASWVPTQDFREIISLIYHPDLFIGLDSGPSHIASALQIPSLIFFDSVNPKYRHLNEHKKIFLQSPCPFTHC